MAVYSYDDAQQVPCTQAIPNTIMLRKSHAQADTPARYPKASSYNYINNSQVQRMNSLIELLMSWERVPVISLARAVMATSLTEMDNWGPQISSLLTPSAQNDFPRSTIFRRPSTTPPPSVSAGLETSQRQLKVPNFLGTNHGLTPTPPSGCRHVELMLAQNAILG